MNIQNKNNVVGDPIIQLPVDQHLPTNNEIQIIDSLFKKHPNKINLIINELKDSILVALIFIILNIPQIDQYIHRFIPITVNSPYIMILIKAIFAALFFWIIKNFSLSRK